MTAPAEPDAPADILDDAVRKAVNRHPSRHAHTDGWGDDCGCGERGDYAEHIADAVLAEVRGQAAAERYRDAQSAEHPLTEADQAAIQSLLHGDRCVGCPGTVEWHAPNCTFLLAIHDAADAALSAPARHDAAAEDMCPTCGRHPGDECDGKVYEAEARAAAAGREEGTE